MRFRSPRKLLVIVGVVAFAATPAFAYSNVTRDTIVIPKIGLNVPLALRMDDGPVKYWWDKDTIAIAGHRTTHSKPFSDLDKLRPGNIIKTSGRTYRVVKTVIIRPWQTWVLRWKGLILSACTPKGSAAYRIVVLAR